MKQELTAIARNYYRLIKRGIEAQRRDYQDFLKSDEAYRGISLSEVLDKLQTSWKSGKKHFFRGLEVLLKNTSEDLNEFNRELDEAIKEDMKERRKYVFLY